VSRLRRIELAGRFFFVTTNLRRNIPPLSPAERDICIAHLERARQQHKFSLFAYAVMQNHVHLLLRTEEVLLPVLMKEWKSSSGFAIAKSRGATGAIWQPRYFDFILRRASDFGKKLQYIHNNPVEAGLVAEPQLWPWSSAAFYINKSVALPARSDIVPIRPDLFDIPSNPNEPLWPVPWR
jgi:putative transposase